MEQTLIILKPDAVKRGLVGKILKIFEEKGIALIDLKMLRPNKSIIDQHYEKFMEEDFFPRIVKFMTSGQVVVCLLKGYNVISNVRTLIGATDPMKAQPGTIRERFASCIEENVIHASENKDEFKRECEIWLKKE